MNTVKNNKYINYLKLAGLGLLCIFIYFFTSSIELDFLKLFNINYKDLPLNIKVIYLISWEIVMMCLIMLILNKKVSRDFSNMKKNHKEYFKKYFKFYLMSLGIMLISNFIINILLNNGLSSNEETLRETFNVSPIYIYFSSVIFAPVVEELVFRQSIRNMIPNKIIFILVSGLLFGGLHILTGYSGPMDLLYLIPYCAPGFAFAYILADSDNIFISIALHLMHNGILISLQFLLLIFS